MTGQPLVYNLSPRVPARLISSAIGSRRDGYFQPGVEAFVAKSDFPWDQSLKLFFGNFVGVVSSELNCGLLVLERRTTITKCASQPIHLADEKAGSHSR